MRNRIFGIVILASFAAALFAVFTSFSGLLTIPYEYALIAVFVMPIMLTALSFGGMGLYFLGRDGSGAVFGVMLVHVIGFSAMLALILRLQPIFQGTLQYLIMLAAASSILFALYWRRDDESVGKIRFVATILFLILLAAVSLLTAMGSSDFLFSIGGSVSFFLLIPSAVPLFLVLISGLRMLQNDTFAPVSDPEIYMPYLLYLGFAIMGAVFGAVLFFIAGLV